jgi:hypothetical protein
MIIGDTAMKDWTKRALDELDILFPSERIEKSKARITALWQGEKPVDRYSVTYSYALFNMYNAQHNPEQRLKRSLEEFSIHGKLNDDFIPALFPGCRTSTIPNMFGAEEVVINGDVSSKQIINTLADIDSLPEPSIGPGTIAHEWLQMQEYFLEETEGRIPVHVTDMQGPVDACGQMFSYDALFLMVYTDPDYYHKLLSRVTDAFIMLWEAQKRLLGDLFVGTHLFGHNWVPTDFGATISADSMVMVGPDFYNEFFRPYIERIGDHFGMLAVHSCGDFSANVNALCRTKHVSGINAAQMSVDELLTAGLDKDTVVIAFSEIGAVKDAYTTIRKHNLLVDLSVNGFSWPQKKTVTNDPKNNFGDNLLIPPPCEWSRRDWDRLRREEDSVLEAAFVINC